MDIVRKLRTLKDDARTRIVIESLTGQILDFFCDQRGDDPGRLVFIGLKTYGLPVAEAISDYVKILPPNIKVPVGVAEVNHYDEALKHGTYPRCSRFLLPDDMPEEPIFIFVDDVFFTGITALATVWNFIQRYPQYVDCEIFLAVLVHRRRLNGTSYRTKPILPQFVGTDEKAAENEVIHVFHDKTTGWGIDLMRKVEEPESAAAAEEAIA